MSYLFENLKILIADDHFLMRQILVIALHEKNIKLVDTAADGQIARDMINRAYIDRHPYDIVFLDWEMPVIAGIDILKYFREQYQFDKTAFVMVTAVITQLQVRDAIRSGATAYLTNPLSVLAVIRKLGEIVAWLAEKNSAKTLRRAGTMRWAAPA
jgi:YesN/AraC family two-component response regulator